MPTDDPSQLFDIPMAELNHIASRVLGDDVTCFGALSIQRIGRSFGSGTLGVFRVNGNAHTSTGVKRWSAVAKISAAAEVRFVGDDVADTPAEVEVYRSGVFDGLCGGVRAAHCYAIHSYSNLQYLWLEDMSEAPQAPWIEKYFIQGARNIGQFNAYWPDEALPRWQWLRDVRFNEFDSPGLQAQLDELAARQEEPLINRVATPEIMYRVREFWKQSEWIFAQAEASSRGVCHADCHPKNLFPIETSSGEQFMVAIDWTHVGIGPLGRDPASMLVSPIKWNELAPEQARRLIEPIFETYLGGLRASGWAGNEAQVRMTYLTAVGCESLALLAHVPAFVDEPKFRAKIESNLGRSFEKIVDHWASMYLFGLDCIDEAVRLTSAL